MAIYTTAMLTVDTEAELPLAPLGAGMLVSVVSTGKLYQRLKSGVLNERADLTISVPVGAILLWSGSTLPIGWKVCDGTNGTTDMTKDKPKTVGVQHIQRV